MCWILCFVPNDNPKTYKHSIWLDLPFEAYLSGVSFLENAILKIYIKKKLEKTIDKFKFSVD